MKDHNGYELRPMDTQDIIVLVACAVAILVLVVLL